MRRFVPGEESTVRLCICCATAEGLVLPLEHGMQMCLLLLRSLMPRRAERPRIALLHLCGEPLELRG